VLCACFFFFSLRYRFYNPTQSCPPSSSNNNNAVLIEPTSNEPLLELQEIEGEEEENALKESPFDELGYELGEFDSTGYVGPSALSGYLNFVPPGETIVEDEIRVEEAGI